jgi:hypothetical protein
VIIGHHGFGEEVVLASLAAGGTATVTGLVVFWRAKLDMLVRWLHRR